jgi:hypothetical protein
MYIIYTVLFYKWNIMQQYLLGYKYEKYIKEYKNKLK